MGIKLNPNEKSTAQYVKDIHEMSRIVTDRMFSAFKRYTLLFMLTPDYWKEQKATQRIKEFTNKVIEDRRRIRAKLQSEGVSPDQITATSDSPSLIDTLLDVEIEGKTLSNDYIIQETQMFLFAGHDTAATTVSTCLYYLAKYKDVQDKVAEELQLIFGDDKRFPTWTDLNDLHYLESVIKETMRFCTIVPTMGRLLEEDLSYGDIFIPKGNRVTIFIAGVHMNPEFYPNPEVFDPSRFDQSKVSSASYMPFGLGIRNCIGQRFAMLESKYLLCQILRNFEILPVMGHTPQLSITLLLTCENGFMIRIKRR